LEAYTALSIGTSSVWPEMRTSFGRSRNWAMMVSYTG
jgi:hypothetical protein